MGQGMGAFEDVGAEDEAFAVTFGFAAGVAGVGTAGDAGIISIKGRNSRISLRYCSLRAGSQSPNSWRVLTHQSRGVAIPGRVQPGDTCVCLKT